MGKSKCGFFSSFKKTRYFDVSEVNYEPVLKLGTCLLKSKHRCLVMVWSIKNYPTEAPMPGSPYPLSLCYSIFEKSEPDCELKSLESMSGELVYQEASGTPPNYNQLGLPFGEYRGLARDNNCDKAYKLKLSLGDDCLEVAIKQFTC
jgi:hypothetical protein